jgi:hypothetical protein
LSQGPDACSFTDTPECVTSGDLGRRERFAQNRCPLRATTGVLKTHLKSQLILDALSSSKSHQSPKSSGLGMLFLCPKSHAFGTHRLRCGISNRNRLDQKLVTGSVSLAMITCPSKDSRNRLIILSSHDLATIDCDNDNSTTTWSSRKRFVKNGIVFYSETMLHNTVETL